MMLSLTQMALGMRRGSVRDREMKMTRFFTAALLVTPALGLAIALSGCGQAQAGAGPTVQSSPAEIRGLRITVEATGEVEPIRILEVKSKASGEILRLHVDIGDRVVPGTLMAEVDPRDVRNAFEQSDADLVVARVRKEIAEEQLAREEELLAAGVITEQEFENQRLDYANAQSQLVRAETNLELAQLKLNDVTIRSPMAGTVLQRNVEEGTVIQSASGNVSGGTTLMIMANLDQMQVRTMVDETDMGQIQAGMTATVTVEAFPDRTFRGEVEKIEPQGVVQQSIVMFPVIVTLDNRQGFLKPGMNAEVEILVAENPDALTVPNNAVVTPQEVIPAAMVLGMAEEDAQIDRSAYQDLFAQLSASSDGSGAEGEDRPTGSEGGHPGGMEGMADVRARMEGGEVSQEQIREMMRAARGGEGGMGGGQRGSSERNGVKQAVAFVVATDGSIEVRPVLMGLSDWEHVEILAGIEEGEQVALIGAAQLQASQQEFMDRMRGRGGMGRMF
ncbi:efflux RND transporter periplasmic adaptor subunit [Gemmatimonadota bacterium]